MSQNLIEIRDIHHKIGSKFSIDLDQLFFQDGPIYAFTGESGAGKSELLKILALLTKVDQGNVKVFDTAAHSEGDQVALRRRLGYLAQQPYLFRGTVFQNIALGLEYRGEDAEHIETRVQKLLKEFDLLKQAHLMVNDLPVGQQKLTAMLRTLAPHPEVLILDEPTNFLDYDQYNHLLDYLYMLNNERGIMIILATKHRDVISRLANISIHMRYGKIVRILTGQHQTGGKDSALRSS